MAIWQITFYIIENYTNNINNDVEFDDTYFWENSSKDEMFFKEIDLFLKKNKSWSSKMQLYGDLKSNCLEIYFSDLGKILSVSFRINFLSKYELTLEKIIFFCALNNLKIVTSKGKIIPLQLKDFKLYILNYIEEHGLEYLGNV